MATEIEKAQALENVLVGGDLSRLTPEQRVMYYDRVCDSLGLNKLTRPFEYITLSGKLTLYARRDCTDQLRKINSVSVKITAREVLNDVYVVTAQAALASGRTDESTGAVPIGNIKGEALANAYMKAETKAKRRVTLSICGLGMLDESEAESVPNASQFVETTAPQLPPADAPPVSPDAPKLLLVKALARWFNMSNTDPEFRARVEEVKTWAGYGDKLTDEQALKLLASVRNYLDEGVTPGTAMKEALA